MARAHRGLILSLGLLAGLAGCRQPDRSDPLVAAQAALQTALELDSSLEGAEDPAAVAAARDAAFEQAETLFGKVQETTPDLPETQLARATIAWRYRLDLATAFRLVNELIDHLGGWSEAELQQPRPGGRSGARLLARAHAERASYLIQRYFDAGRPASLPHGPLAQARADVERALRLADDPEFLLLLGQIERLESAAHTPLDPAALTPAP